MRLHTDDDILPPIGIGTVAVGCTQLVRIALAAGHHVTAGRLVTRFFSLALRTQERWIHIGVGTSQSMSHLEGHVYSRTTNDKLPVPSSL